MRTRLSTSLTALTAIVVLALPGRAAAQHQRDAPYPYILIDLGTFGGNWSVANAVNDRGQVVGVATNAIPDSFPATLNAFGFFDFPYPDWGATQNRAFLWQHGQLQDLGTLGGAYAQAVAINAGGQVAGLSTTTAITNPTTGLPTVHPFVWDQGTMRDLGTLGGTFAFPIGINDRGDVAGTSTLAGDQSYHPFLWTRGKLIDLGTFGGDVGQTHWIDQAGDVAGWALTTGNATAHAALWTHGSPTPIDLGTPPGQPCAFADMVNARDQVVGGSCTSNPTGLLWEHGTISDLNTLVAPSAVHLIEAHAINDRGEIVAIGAFTNGNQHVVLLVPSDLAEREGLSSNAPAPGTAGPTNTAQARPIFCALVPVWRGGLAHQYHRPCLVA